MNVFRDRQNEDVALAEMVRWLLEYREYAPRIPIPSLPDRGTPTPQQLEARNRAINERDNSVHELKMLNDCVRTSIYKVGGVTAASLVGSYYGYRKLLPARRFFAPLTLSVLSTIFISSAAQKVWFDAGCKREFLQRTPASQYPLAAKARAVLRSNCPTHPFLENIPAALDDESVLETLKTKQKESNDKSRDI